MFPTVLRAIQKDRVLTLQSDCLAKVSSDSILGRPATDGTYEQLPGRIYVGSTIKCIPLKTENKVEKNQNVSVFPY